MTHFLKFIGLMFVMYILSLIPFGMYVNAGITLVALWNLVK